MINSVATTPAAIDPAHYRDRILVELIASVCARLGIIVLTEAVVATTMIVALLWEVATPPQMAAWLAAHFGLTMMHGYVYFRFRIDGTASIKLLQLGLRLSIGLLGIYWAALLAYMFVVTPDYALHLYLFMFAGALGVLAVVLASEDMPTFIGFIAPPGIVLATMAVATLHPKYLTVAALSLLCDVSLVLFARHKNRSATESLAMRFTMADLADELREQRDAAQRANVAKSKFLAAASHDLRQPLHALTLLTTALHDSNLDSNARGIANDMSGSIGSLEKMFGALLDISKLDAGVLHPEPMHFDVGIMLRRIADEYSLPAQVKGLNLLCQPTELLVHTDAMLLERIVRNFVANAVRYTHAGTIRIACHELDKRVRIEVADTGIGIAAAQQAEIFDEFYQVDNPERDRSKGLGLGLAIVRRIAELLRLDFGVESSPHQGSTFFVTVPRGNIARVTQVGEDQSASRQKLTGLCVLVIDDDIAVRESMRKLLTAWDCQVAVSGDAEQAVTAARAQFALPDAMIVDYRLRDERTGIEAIGILRTAFDADIPALIVSGDTAPARLREVAASGHTMVHKPAQPAALRSFLSKALRAKSSVAHRGK